MPVRATTFQHFKQGPAKNVVDWVITRKRGLIFVGCRTSWTVRYSWMKDWILPSYPQSTIPPFDRRVVLTLFQLCKTSWETSKLRLIHLIIQYCCRKRCKHACICLVLDRRSRCTLVLIRVGPSVFYRERLVEYAKITQILVVFLWFSALTHYSNH